MADNDDDFLTYSSTIPLEDILYTDDTDQPLGGTDDDPCGGVEKAEDIFPRKRKKRTFRTKEKPSKKSSKKKKSKKKSAKEKEEEDVLILLESDDEDVLEVDANVSLDYTIPEVQKNMRQVEQTQQLARSMRSKSSHTPEKPYVEIIDDEADDEPVEVAPRFITLQIETAGMRTNTQMMSNYTFNELYTSIAASRKVPVQDVALKYYGMPLDPHKTPDHYYMAEGDLITTHFPSADELGEDVHDVEDEDEGEEDEGDGDDDDDDCVTVTVNDKTSSHEFKLKKTDSMIKLLVAFCKATGKKKTQTKLVFDGRVVTKNDTPESLEIEDDDVIDAT